MAGPNLTPATFEAGLQRTVFPNPDHPIKAAKVGFQNGSHTMTIDSVQWWWSNSGRSPYPEEGAGTMCYTNDGGRFAKGRWPVGAEDPFFKEPCFSGA